MAENLTDSIMSDNRILKLMDELGESLTKEERELLIQVIKSNHGGEIDALTDLMGYTYERQPVPMRQFIEDEEYLGLKGQVYPVILDDLEELFDSTKYNEAVLTGGIGWGKSFFAETALTRMVYEASCLRNPQRMFGLADGSIIAFVNVSINLQQAKNVVFTGIKNKMLNSKYFKNIFPYDSNLKTEMRFPKGIWISPAASSEGGVIGLNVFGGVLDEVNFMAIVSNSKQSSDGGTYDQATQLHNALIRRMKSRFMKQGKLPGILLAISSSRYPDDFTERRIKEVTENAETDVFVRRYEQWATKKKGTYSGVTFSVCLGDALVRSHIVKTDEERAEDKKKNLEVIEVPIEYKRDFVKDIDMAIRDIAGRPTLAIRPFILQKEKLYQAIQWGRELHMVHPFSKEVTTLRDGAVLIREMFCTKSIEDIQKQHYIHIDLGLTGDGCGFCMGHVTAMKKVIRRDLKSNIEFTETAPIIMTDLMLRIVAEPDKEIQIGDVRALVYELRSFGFFIKKVTFDQFQSSDSIQQLNNIGIESENLSVDSKLDAYNSFKDALYEDRMIMYDYLPAVTEAVRLEKVELKNKVDHPKSGSKDVTDAIAGMCYHCSMQEQSTTVAQSLGELDELPEQSSNEEKHNIYDFDPLEYYFNQIEKDIF